ncbi:MAG TPA: S9 family peptidase [Streptosporangiaceae bacterium]|nr:S9 family peptidase [Streptosporangiaceae bacterium]
MAEYRDFLAAQRFQRFVALSADGTQVAYSADTSGQFNLHTQPVNGGTARQLTSFSGQSVRSAAWSPDGILLAFTADTGGDEQTQVFTMPAAGGQARIVSSPADRQFMIAEKTAFGPSGRYLLGGGNDPDPANPGLTIWDLHGGPPAHFPGPRPGITFPVAISPDGRYAVAGIYTTNVNYHCCLADLHSPGQPAELLTGDLPAGIFYPGQWAADSSGFYLRTTSGADRTRLAIFALADRSLVTVDAPDWDVEDVTVSADGRTVVWSVNEDGRSVLYGQRDGSPLALPQIPDGVVEAMDLSADGSALALMLDTPARPQSVAVASLEPGGTLRYLTESRSATARSAAAVIPQLYRYPARDGTPIPALVYRPAGTGHHPVVLSIHGGPEQQERPQHDALYRCLLAAGVGVVAPNMRGSSGYGMAWQRRIYRDWGGIDLDDFAAAAAWLHTQDWADSRRLAVIGYSYGGFAALSCLSRLPDLWSAGVSCYGPANLETLARSMPPDWAPMVREMFGDPDADADDMRRRSPVTYAGQITAPLLVVQGANDPRVPKAESDQIVEKVRANGVEAEYLVFGDEGHGFTNRDNDITAHSAILAFLLKHLQ